MALTFAERELLPPARWRLAGQQDRSLMRATTEYRYLEAILRVMSILREQYVYMYFGQIFNVYLTRMFQNTDRYWSTEPCRLGYKRDASTGYCVDIDECVVGPGCRDHERCTNTPGGYDCSPLCSIGWYFSTTTKGCQDVDECLLGRHDCPQSTHRYTSLIM